MKKQNGLLWFKALVGVVLLIVFIIYFWTFGLPNLANNNIKDWIDVVVYFNNLLSPALLLGTIILLYKSWKTSERVVTGQNDVLALGVVKENIIFYINNTCETVPLNIKPLREKFEANSIEELNALNFLKKEKWFSDDEFKQFEDELKQYQNGRKHIQKDLTALNVFLFLSEKDQFDPREISKTMVAIYALQETQFLQNMDAAFKSIFHFISRIESPTLRSIIFKLIASEYKSNLSTQGFFLFYKVRYKTLKLDNLLKTCIEQFYEEVHFSQILLRPEFEKLAKLKL